MKRNYSSGDDADGIKIIIKKLDLFITESPLTVKRCCFQNY